MTAARTATPNDAADRPASAAPTARSVDTTQKTEPAAPQAQAAGDALPKLPHERDQSVDMTGGQPDAEVQQAYRDVSRGLQDTDKGPPADRAYQKLKR